MNFLERLIYALISGFLGAIVGFAGWWLYGQAHSLNYEGPAMHPVMQHWLQYSVACFAVIGFILKDHAAEIVGDAFAAIFHFELDLTPDRMFRLFGALVFLAICLAAIWFTAH